MKTKHPFSSLVRGWLATGLATLLLAGTHVHGAAVIVPDSLILAAVRGTNYFTFKDPASGESVIVSIVMTPFSSGAGDPFNPIAAGTRAGIGVAGAPGADAIQSAEGVDITATLVFASRGVAPGSVKFQIGSLGLRGVPGLPAANLTWRSSATVPPAFPVALEVPYLLDSVPVTISGTIYTAQLRHDALAGGPYQLSDAGVIAGQGLVMHVEFNTMAADPHAGSWFTDTANRYARIYRTEAEKLAGISVTTWSSPSAPGLPPSLVQSLPAYAGVQEIYLAADDVYIRSTGLGGQVMGPWTNGTLPFPNVPTNQKSLWHFPRAPRVPAVKTMTPTSTIGYFVDGVAIFDSWSGFYYAVVPPPVGSPAGTPPTYEEKQGAAPGGHWNGNAYETEKITFDPSLGHPEQNGIQHIHSNPLAARARAGDHVNFDPLTTAYSESSATTIVHSPIVGWMQDGFPLYGPYGFSIPTNASSPIVPMRTGYALRNGTLGTDDLADLAVGRTSRPLWALRRSTAVAADSSPTGPPVDASSYPLGHFMEDYAYRGDLLVTSSLGTDFDLDEFNGRWCVTPEFPLGTYAYFVAIDDVGQPAFPYMIGRAFQGDPSLGGAYASPLPAGVTTLFDSMADLRPSLEVPELATPASSPPTVTLTWTAGVEGGIYEISRSSDMTTWTPLPSTVTATDTTVSATFPVPLAALDLQIFRVALDEVSHFDAATAIPGPGTSLGVKSVSPYSMPADITVTLDIVLSALLPAGLPAAVTLGKAAAISAAGTSVSRAGDIITAKFDLRGLAGTYDVVVEFPAGTKATLNGGFTVR